MDIIVVDRFLCCMKLETGAYLLGSLGIVSNLAGLVLLGVALVYAVYFFKDLVEMIKANLADFPRMDPILESQVYMILTLSVVTFLILISLFASVQLILGTKHRNCHQLVPYMILLALGIGISFLQLLEGTVDAVVNTAINVIVDGYIFICINSLYIKFEHMNKFKISEIPKNLV